MPRRCPVRVGMGGVAVTLRSLRTVVAPLLLSFVVGGAFWRALAPSDLATGVAAGAVAGWIIAIASSLAVRSIDHRLVGLGAAGALAVGGFVGSLALVAGGAGIGSVADAVITFLAVGIPARGLDHLAVVAVLVLFPVAALTTWASLGRHTLATVSVPVVGLGVVELLVAPVGVSWWCPVALVVVSAAVMAADARSEISDLPSLTDAPPPGERRVEAGRSLLQLAPAGALAAVLVVLLPLPGTYDIRRHVDPPTIRVDDLSPLAVAAHWTLLDDPGDAVEVAVTGASPGRLRLAVLEEFRDTGWRQAAEFAVTGDRLVGDPVFEDEDLPAADLTTVTIDLVEGWRGFHAVPTAGFPESIDEPQGMRYAAGQGLLLPAQRDRPLTYRTRPGARAAPTLAAPPVIDLPPHLGECPASPAIRDVATQLTSDTVVASERLDRIESWLLTRRVYDPEAPGGQTIGAVERFVGQPFARGNLEVFVSSYALLARCAGVPTRVVVGFAAPSEGHSVYTQGDIQVWVETPLVGTGWVPLDPVPTPEEQLLLAQLAQPTPPSTDEVDEDEAPPPIRVEPAATPDESNPTRTALIAGLGVLLALVATMVAWALLAPWLVRRRRSRTANPTAAIAAAWTTVCDALIDRHIPIAEHHTPTEVARLVSGQVPAATHWLISDLGPLVDRARFGESDATADDAALAWAYTHAILDRLPQTRRDRIAQLAHPVRTYRRLRLTSATPRVRKAWSGSLPDTALVGADEAPADIPGVEIQARIGDGSTGTVYRGSHSETSRPVAVKVFRFGPGDLGFDQQRFDWEVRVAQGVSGLPHLPEVLSAGITPVTERAFLVSTLYDEGTLLDRIRRGGSMTSAEALDIGIDLAAALDALHQLGVIHGDVKPENVFASADGWILGDLGSAWLRASRGPAASLTPPYAAPEVWRGASPTPSSDLYSLALTMLFACTGMVPIAGNPPPLADIEAAFPDHPVIARALDPNARRRPRGVGDFARKLRPELLPSTVARTRTLNLPTPTVSHSRNLN